MTEQARPIELTIKVEIKDPVLKTSRERTVGATVDATLIKCVVSKEDDADGCFVDLRDGRTWDCLEPRATVVQKWMA